MTLAVGSVVDAVFQPNPRSGSPYRWRATTVRGRRADKAILTNDDRIRPGVPCSVIVTRVRKPSVPGMGFYEARFHGEASLTLPDHIWIPDLTRLRMAGLLARGRCILLRGPQGCGKTVITEAIAGALGYTYVYANANAAIEPTDFVARFELRQAEGGGAETTWLPSPMLEAILEADRQPDRRFAVFLDELNRCRETARNGLMSALDATRAIYDPIIGSFRRIPANVQFIAAVNVGSQFTGTTSIDAATLDRFAPVTLDYPPPAVEQRLIERAVDGARRAVIGPVLRIAKAIRAEPDILGGVSVRATIDAVETLSQPAIAALGRPAQREVIREAFCGRLDGVWDDPTSDAGRADRIIEKHLRPKKSAAATAAPDDGTPF
jgi:nitric oxide reductase NorQ protein